MKCIKSVTDNAVTRVKDEVARKKVATGNFKYVPKSEWKAVVDIAPMK